MSDMRLYESAKAPPARVQPAIPAETRCAIVSLPVEIDLTNAQDVGARLASALGMGAAVVVADMTATRFCGLSGIAMLMLAVRQGAANGIELRLVVSSAAILRVLAVTGLDSQLPIYPSLAEALAPEVRGTMLARVSFGAELGRRCPETT